MVTGNGRLVASAPGWIIGVDPPTREARHNSTIQLGQTVALVTLPALSAWQTDAAKKLWDPLVNP